MIKNSRKDSGSIFIIGVIVVTVVILGAVGYVAWNKFSSQQETHTTTEEQDQTSAVDVSTPIEDKEYNNDKLSFKYPGSNWSVEDLENADDIAVLNTNDYKHNVGMGVESGALLRVYYTFQQEIPDMPGIKDIEQIQIDGNKGFKYAVEYEGYRLNAFFTVNVETNEEKSYGVTMETVGVATDSEKETFNLILNTIKLNN